MKVAPARLWILAARDRPVAVVIRRGPTKVFRTLAWNTETDEITNGGTLNGLFYPTRCDVSFDGKYWVYLGSGGSDMVNAVSEVPRLEPIVSWRNAGSWYGGGFFNGERSILRPPEFSPLGALFSMYSPAEGDRRSEFKIGRLGVGKNILHLRLQRDGWENMGNRWWRRPTPVHPRLLLVNEGFIPGKGETFRFEVESAKLAFNEGIHWATWDCLGQLLVARRGILERYRLQDLADMSPTFSLDLNNSEGEAPQK